MTSNSNKRFVKAFAAGEAETGSYITSGFTQEGCSGSEGDDASECGFVSVGLGRAPRSQVTVMFNNDYHHAPAPPH